MFKNSLKFSTVTAVLPSGTSPRVMGALLELDGASVASWRARGTLLQDNWRQRFVPSISPAKSMLQLLVPDEDVDQVVSTVVERGKLHQQAAGAVFSTPCEHIYLGSDFRIWPSHGAPRAAAEHTTLKAGLSIIYCMVGHRFSDTVARAAINAGAHGPIVYYSEGRGLRDRLGWLRMTKEHEQEVLMVIADENEVEEIFDAMATAGEFHLPGRGLMYRLAIDKGMFNLPSRVAHRHHTASMQQIIHAIDHLAGHAHWRDQAVFNVGNAGKGKGLAFLEQHAPVLTNQVCLSAILQRNDAAALTELILDAGAPGLTVNYARLNTPNVGGDADGARVNNEYALFRSIVDQKSAESVCAAIDESADLAGIRDLCVIVNAVPRVARYVRGTKDYRVQTGTASAA